MNPLPSLILDEAMNGFSISERGYIREPKQASNTLDVEEVLRVKQKRKYIKKNKLFIEKENIEIEEGGFGQNQAMEEEVLVKQKRKYVKKSKVPIALKARQAPNNEEITPPSPDQQVGGLVPSIEEEAGEERDLDNRRRKRGNKFDHVFISGFHSIAIDGLELQKLVRKLIRTKARKEKLQSWAEVCSNYKIIISAELRAVKAELEVMKLVITRGDGHMPMKRRVPEGLENVVDLALEALEEVAKTWKNSHAIFVSVKKSLQDMDCFVGYMEFRRQDPDYWWTKTGGFALEDIPSGTHYALGETMQGDEKGKPEIHGGNEEDGKERLAMEVSDEYNSDENQTEVEDGKHLKQEGEFEHDLEEYFGQEYRELVGGRLDFSCRKADW